MRFLASEGTWKLISVFALLPCCPLPNEILLLLGAPYGVYTVILFAESVEQDLLRLTVPLNPVDKLVLLFRAEKLEPSDEQKSEKDLSHTVMVLVRRPVTCPAGPVAPVGPLSPWMP